MQLVDLWENVREHWTVDLLVVQWAVKRDERMVAKMAEL